MTPVIEVARSTFVRAAEPQRHRRLECQQCAQRVHFSELANTTFLESVVTRIEAQD